jgi:hypothetical protein
VVVGAAVLLPESVVEVAEAVIVVEVMESDVDMESVAVAVAEVVLDGESVVVSSDAAEGSVEVGATAHIGKMTPVAGV